ncbi:TIGR03086 family metal-binding protein [Mycobacterium gordonae]|jgi:uncharacterized protein (TIGR03086 family)|uniref:ArsR family transcriptional regulator n=1 Tax=Mycobacterium gordonae TaxID=1778 RepID=A0A1X1X9Z5_MYCGO|nr:TIGR03086 family metal-binding protein [Mycobacterium gordonae]MBI2699879.1 TIGR03086 family protein [Mycobacterium sp.]MBX9983241.1 TIGR03086 family protein [Mycobacterium gordonae]MCQ4364663.1 TIGR03086 family metal-binding protein [Mycobacterium gordonae]MCV7008056.1 TIGR03086 family protein [Mycobacterium gordonae]ODR17647.1 TIGR03086 family protein [Mycobacterium gordonae]
MPDDLVPGPESPPTDELRSAELSLGVLQQVLHTVAGSDKSKQTPCSEYNVKDLTGHLVNSITSLGGMAGAEFDVHPDTDSVEQLVVTAARQALDAWHKRGLDGEVAFGSGSMPARVAVAVFSIEFLVHAWDYARAVGHDVDAPDSLAEYVLGWAQKVIKPEQRGPAGFDDPVSVPDDADPLTRLIAFTGRNPA